MYSNTPFGHGLTFNGFAKNLKLETILDCRVHSNGTLLFLVKWRNDGNRVRQIESSLLRTYSPQMLMDFYEKKMVDYHS
ncbi:nucleomorphin-like [Aphis craccivora]|uniref:Nucleomorphin-like n=1 Tax=Aphis craccivora TaxID=307492 RepID=A0A6G0Y6Z0_APHCR|nr:nucleomorphin-like [Aphis craccivora]